jgi:hypothetical protein
MAVSNAPDSIVSDEARAHQIYQWAYGDAGDGSEIAAALPPAFAAWALNAAIHLRGRCDYGYIVRGARIAARNGVHVDISPKTWYDVVGESGTVYAVNMVVSDPWCNCPDHTQQRKKALYAGGMRRSIWCEHICAVAYFTGLFAEPVTIGVS